MARAEGRRLRRVLPILFERVLDLPAVFFAAADAFDVVLPAFCEIAAVDLPEAPAESADCAATDATRNNALNTLARQRGSAKTDDLNNFIDSM